MCQPALRVSRFGPRIAEIQVGAKIDPEKNKTRKEAVISADDSRVTVQVSIQTDDGVYLLGGEPVRINGDFVLETRLRRVTGVIESIIQEGGAA